MQEQIKNYISSYLTDAFIDAVESFQDLVQKSGSSSQFEKMSKNSFVDIGVYMGNNKNLIVKQAINLSPGYNKNVAIQVIVLRVLWTKIQTFILVTDNKKFKNKNSLSAQVNDIDQMFCIVVQTLQFHAPYFQNWKKGLGPRSVLFVKQPYIELELINDLQIIRVVVQNVQVKKSFNECFDSYSLKRIGNDYYRKQDYVNALNYYQYALTCSHKIKDTGNKQFDANKTKQSAQKQLRSVLYTNSAASLYKMNLYDNCLKYCGITIKIDRNYYKSFAWKVNCLLEKKMFSQIPNLLIILKSKANPEDFAKINLKYSIYLANSLGMYNWKDITDQIRYRVNNFNEKGKNEDILIAEYFSKFIGQKMINQKAIYYTLQNIKKHSILIITKALVYDKKGLTNKILLYQKIIKCFQLQKYSFNHGFKDLFGPYDQNGGFMHDTKLQKKQIQSKIARFLIKPLDITQASPAQALGIWSQLNKFGHSCNPNCTIIHFENIMLVSAFTDISQGTALTIDYAMDVNPLKRKDHLLLKYNIFCKCSLCQWKAWPNFQNKDQVSKVANSLTNVTMIKQIFWQLIGSNFTKGQQKLLQKSIKLITKQINWTDLLTAMRLLRSNNSSTGILMDILTTGLVNFLKIPHKLAVKIINNIK